MKYTQAFDGEWIIPARKGYKVACCQCGLVHRMEFRVVKGRVQFRAWQDNRATAGRRRGKAASVIKDAELLLRAIESTVETKIRIMPGSPCHKKIKQVIQLLRASGYHW